MYITCGDEGVLGGLGCGLVGGVKFVCRVQMALCRKVFEHPFDES